jgi:hypothetical protein
LRGTPGTPVWQRNYYEHIIRDDESLNRIRQYIIDNPVRWALDHENPAMAGGVTRTMQGDTGDVGNAGGDAGVSVGRGDRPVAPAARHQGPDHRRP